MPMNPVAARPAGRLEVIAGPMFSGKSEELMRRVRRAKIAGVNVLVISHSLDTRSDLSAITSHIGVNVPAVPVGDVASLAEVAHTENFDLVAIDEAQFFGPDLIPVVVELVERGATVIVEGLCVTFDGGPFEPMPTFMAVAEDVLKLTAVCTICGRDAVFHQRVSSSALTTEQTSESADLAAADLAAENLKAEDHTATDNVSAEPRATDIDATHIGGLESYVARCRWHFAPPR